MINLDHVIYQKIDKRGGPKVSGCPRTPILCSLHHILETCHRLRRLCRKHSNNVAQHDKTPVKSTLLSRDKNILSSDMIFKSHRSDIML